MKNRTIKNNGFSLIELIIAMTLGLFLIAGVSTVYLSSKQTYKLRDQTSELDENARAALRALKQHVEHAGYASTSGIVIPNYIIPTSTVLPEVSCADGDPNVLSTTVIDSSNDGDAATGGDTIGLIFLADEQLRTDCTGSPLRTECLPPDAAARTASMIYNSFSIGSTRKNQVGDAIPELRCGGSVSAARQPWAEGVDNIQFQYGIDMNADGSVENYWNATQVKTSNSWDKIISVRVGLLVRSVDPVFEEPQSQSFQVLDETIEKINTRYKFGVYTTTMRLKNVARRTEQG